MVTPVDTRGPLNPVYTQPTPRLDDDLDVQPSRDPRDPLADTPLGRHLPWVDTPWSYTPLGKHSSGQTPPGRHHPG